MILKTNFEESKRVSTARGFLGYRTLSFNKNLPHLFKYKALMQNEARKCSTMKKS